MSVVGPTVRYAAGRGDGGAEFSALAAKLPQLVKDAYTETAGMAPFKENPNRLNYALAMLQAV